MAGDKGAPSLRANLGLASFASHHQSNDLGIDQRDRYGKSNFCRGTLVCKITSESCGF